MSSIPTTIIAPVTISSLCPVFISSLRWQDGDLAQVQYRLPLGLTVRQSELVSTSPSPFELKREVRL